MDDSDSDQQLEDLLEKALECPPEERERFLTEASGISDEVRDKVRSLVRSESAAAAFMSDPTVSKDQDALEDDGMIGTEIGAYKILQRLGEGGYGVVYLAEQRAPVNRRVALKVIKPGMDTKQVIARFEAERQALAMMEHPNIAKVFDASATDSGRPYFVMEVVRGMPVTTYCEENALGTHDRLILFSKICQAVNHAHQKGIIHRDLKPNNILVTLHDGVPVPKVIDFGIAKATHSRLTEKTLFTNFQQFVGTPAYTSPEQVEMSGLDVDTRSDIYSLGVLLYELLTGTTPIESETLKKAAYAEIQRTILETEPPKPSNRLTDILNRSPTVQKRRIAPAELKRELDWITMKALAKDRTRRYDSAGAFAKDVERYLANEPVEAAAPSVAYLSLKAIQRHRTLALGVSAVALFLAVALILTAIGYRQVSEREERLLDSRYAHDMQAVALAFERGHGARAREMIDRHEPKLGERDRREWLWRYWKGRLSQGTALAEVPFRAEALVASPDGGWLAVFGRDQTRILSLPDFEFVRSLSVASRRPFGGVFTDNGQNLRLWNEKLTIVELDSFASTPSIPTFPRPMRGDFHVPTSDGKWMISVEWVAEDPHIARAIRLRCLDLGGDTSKPIGTSELITPPNRFMLENYIKASPDNRFVTVGAADRSMRILGLPTMEEIVRISIQDHANTTAWSPDSSKLAIGYDFPQSVDIWDVSSHQGEMRLDSPAVGPKSGLVFSPDVSLVAASHMGGAILVWNVETGELVNQFLSERVAAMTFLPDNTLIGVADGRLQQWEVDKAPEKTELEGLAQTHTNWNLAYNSDGSILATTASDGVVRLFDGRSFDLVHEFPSRQHAGGHRPPYGGSPLAFAPDDRTLVAANGDQSVSVLDMVTRTERMHLIGHKGAIANLAISADGDLLATTGEDRVMVVWDLVTGEERERFPNPGPKWIDFSPQEGSQLLAYRDRDGVGLIDLDARKKHYHATNEDVWVMQFTPDGAHVLVGINGAESWLFDTVHFRKEGSLPPVAGAVTPSYSPNGRNLVMPSWGHSAQLWHMETGASLGPVPLPHECNWVYSAVFAPGGETLVVSTRGHGVHILEAPSFKDLGY